MPGLGSFIADEGVFFLPRNESAMDARFIFLSYYLSKGFLTPEAMLSLEQRVRTTKFYSDEAINLTYYLGLKIGAQEQCFTARLSILPPEVACLQMFRQQSFIENFFYVYPQMFPFSCGQQVLACLFVPPKPFITYCEAPPPNSKLFSPLSGKRRRVERAIISCGREKEKKRKGELKSRAKRGPKWPLEFFFSFPARNFSGGPPFVRENWVKTKKASLTSFSFVSHRLHSFCKAWDSEFGEEKCWKKSLFFFS